MRKNRYLHLATILLASILGTTMYPRGKSGLAVTMKPITTAWARLETSISQMKIAPKGRFIAFTTLEQKGLSIMDLRNRKVRRISSEHVGASFFWTPDGQRIIYREIGREKSPIQQRRATASSSSSSSSSAKRKRMIKSKVKIYDTKLARSITTETYSHRTGYLTFDPKEMRYSLMYANGIHSKKLSFPNSRLARWQLAQSKTLGRWVAAQNGILWVSQGGLAMRRMSDDNSSVESFDISPDGQSIAWATKKGRVFTSFLGNTPEFAGFGRDPDWHPRKNILLFSGARMLGDKAIGYDLKILDSTGRSRWITQTQFSMERWPQWELDREGIIFTKEKTTDIFVMDFRT